MSDSGLLSRASVLKRDRKGDLRNGMVRMANPPPKATPESFCFLLFLLGVRRAYFGLGYQRDKGSKKLQVFTPQVWAAAHFRDGEIPGSTHRNLRTCPIWAQRSSRYPHYSPEAEPREWLWEVTAAEQDQDTETPHQVSSCPSPSGHSYSNSYTSPLLCHKCHSEDTLSA